MKKPDLVVSFSGGRTSAYMSYWLKRNKSEEYNLHFVFANTGREDERTLDFVLDCDANFNLNLTWLEAVTHKGERKGCTHNVVSFDTADRKGRVFEEVIQKYGIPNKAYPHCNRELKLNPIKSWMKESGLKDAHTAIGIRADEIDRMSIKTEENKLIYPLISMNPMTKAAVIKWWKDQPFGFDLDVPEHYGNCITCFKKSDRKLMTIAKRDGKQFKWADDMERKYGSIGCTEDTRRVFFRSNTSARKLVGRAIIEDFKAFDERTKEYQHELDLSNGCSDSCDIYAD